MGPMSMHAEETLVSVSVVVAAYNVGPYLEECLSAITLAVGPGDEVIVVNDGSTDKTGEIVDRWCAEAHAGGSRRVIHQVNRGVAAARRAGMKAATKEYVLFADGDDVLVPEAYRIATEVLNQVRPDILVTDYWNWLPGAPSPLTPSPARTHVKALKIQDPVENLRHTLIDSIPSLWSRFFSKKLLERVDHEILHEHSIYDDFRSTPYLVAAASSLWYEPVRLVKYRQNTSGLTKIQSERSCRDMIESSIHVSKAGDHLMAKTELIPINSAFLMRKLRDAMRMSRRVEGLSSAKRWQMARPVVVSLTWGHAFRGILFLMKTGRFGDIKALLGFLMLRLFGVGYCMLLLRSKSLGASNQGVAR